MIINVILSVILLVLGHVFKIKRWKQFIDIYEKSDNKVLGRALSVGYLVNFFIPFRLGDIIRAIYSGRYMKNGISFSLATVIVDRYLDIIIVGVIFLIFNLNNFSSDVITNSSIFYIYLSIILIILSVLALRFTKYIKICIKNLGRIFNIKIEAEILYFSWAMITAFKDLYLRINRKQFFSNTIIMWLCYLTSYYLFSIFISSKGYNFTLVDIFTLLFSHSNINGATRDLVNTTSNVFTNYPLLFSLYLIIPLIILLIFSAFQHNSKNEKESDFSKRELLKLLPHTDSDERMNFLEAYFSGENREYFKKYLEINGDILILKDYSAGSNATTMLCKNDEDIFFRKYALGDEGVKLNEQLQWMNKHKNNLQLANIIREKNEIGYCYYDMEYEKSANSLFEFIHTNPVEQSWFLIESVLNDISDNLHQSEYVGNESELILYIESKVMKNLTLIKTSAVFKEIVEYELLEINGVNYKNIGFFDDILSRGFLMEVFKNDLTSQIHGDLTVENIVSFNNQQESNYYLIDPNPNNIWNSPNLDYAKLLQSLHGNYEFLMKSNEFEINGNKISYLDSTSNTYSILMNNYKIYLENKFSDEKVRSIYFHEIVHWLRLLPYKINKDGDKALIFYAQLIILLNEIYTNYLVIKEKEELDEKEISYI